MADNLHACAQTSVSPPPLEAQVKHMTTEELADMFQAIPAVKEPKPVSSGGESKTR